MQKLHFTAVLAVAGLLAASQVSYANTLAPNLNGQTATASSLVVTVKDSGGHGSFGAGRPGGAMGRSSGAIGRSGNAMGRSSSTMGRATIGNNFGARRSVMAGQGRTFARHFHRGHGFAGGSAGIWGYDSDSVYSDYSDGGGSCYLNCRNAGYGPGYCQANSYDFCE